MPAARAAAAAASPAGKSKAKAVSGGELLNRRVQLQSARPQLDKALGTAIKYVKPEGADGVAKYHVRLEQPPVIDGKQVKDVVPWQSTRLEDALLRKYVMLRGIKEKIHLNGMRGRVTAFNQEDERYTVEVQGPPLRTVRLPSRYLALLEKSGQPEPRREEASPRNAAPRREAQAEGTSAKDMAQAKAAPSKKIGAAPAEAKRAKLAPTVHEEKKKAQPPQEVLKQEVAGGGTSDEPRRAARFCAGDHVKARFGMELDLFDEDLHLRGQWFTATIVGVEEQTVSASFHC